MKPCIHRSLASLLLIVSLSANAGKPPGQHTGNGGETYVSQLEEARLMAKELMVANQTLPTSNDLSLQRIYAKHRTKWINVLSNFTVEKSYEVLKDREGDNRSKAALAVPKLQQVLLSVPYWEANPVTMFQSVVLAIHESGHLAKVPASHEDLDHIGRALALTRYQESLGNMVLQEIVRRKPNASRYEVLKNFYEASFEALDMNRLPDVKDFNPQAKLPHTCAFLMKEEDGFDTLLESRRFTLYHGAVPAQPASDSLPMGPLFPDASRPAYEYVDLFSSKSHSDSKIGKFIRMLSRITARDLVLSFGEVLIHKKWDTNRVRNEPIEIHEYVSTEFHFRQNEDLFSFAVPQLASEIPKQLGYGYCWKE